MSEEEKNTRVCFVARPVLPLGVQVCLPVSFCRVNINDESPVASLRRFKKETCHKHLRLRISS